MKKVIMIVGAVVLGIGVFFAGFYARPHVDKTQSTGNTSAARKFVEEVTSGNTDAAYSLTTKSLQDRQNKEDFTKTVSTLKAEKPTFSQSQAVKSGESIVYYQRVLNMPQDSFGSTNAEFFITLDKDGGEWKVSNVSVQ